MMDFMSEALSQPAATIAVISLLAGLGIFVIISRISNQILGVILYPTAIFTGLCASKLFQDYHFYAHRAFDKWMIFTILSATIGMSLAMALYIVLSRIIGLLGAGRQPVELNDLRVRRIQLNAGKNS